MSFDELIEKNIRKIKELEKLIKKDKKNKELIKQLEINKKIGDLLKSGETIFFKISMDDSIKILEQIIDKEKAKEVYLDFISAEQYSKLLKKFEI